MSSFHLILFDLQAEADEDKVPMDFYNAPPVALAYPNPALVSQAADLLSKAERPLIIVGKGAAHARAEEEICKLVENTKLPFLPTPMGMYEMSRILYNIMEW